jgi:hypothetical protein
MLYQAAGILICKQKFAFCAFFPKTNPANLNQKMSVIQQRQGKRILFFKPLFLFKFHQMISVL